MDEEILFTCNFCGEDFEPHGDAMVSLTTSVYLLSKSNGEIKMEWEGVAELSHQPISDDLTVYPLTMPAELANTAICLCVKCRNKLN